MKLKFEIQPTAKPTPDKDRAARLADPGFGRVFTDHMAIVRYAEANGWHDARVEARATDHARSGLRRAALRAGDLRGAEGLPERDGGVSLFRPEANAARFSDSAGGMAMPPAARSPVHRSGRADHPLDRDWIPTVEGSLYLRPFMFATEVFLGVHPSAEYLFVVIASPVGTYFKGGAPAVSIWVSQTTPAPRPAAPARPNAAAITPPACRPGRGDRARLRPGRVPRRRRAQAMSTSSAA